MSRAMLLIVGWLLVSSLRGATAVETRATLKVVSTRVECLLIYSKTEKATLLSLPWTQIAILIQMKQYFL